MAPGRFSSLKKNVFDSGWNPQDSPLKVEPCAGRWVGFLHSKKMFSIAGRTRRIVRPVEPCAGIYTGKRCNQEARALWKRGAAGSNPVFPTSKNRRY